MKARLVWALLPLCVALTAGTGILARENDRLSWNGFSTAITGLVVVSLAVLIVSRRPENAVGWILLVGSLSIFVGEFLGQWALYTLLTRPGALPFGLAAAWLSLWLWAPMIFMLFVLLPLLFPTGRPLSSRWRIVLWIAIIYLAIFIILAGLQPGPMEQFEPIPNPLGLAALASIWEPVVDALELLLLPMILLALLSLALRYRFSKGEERAQMKWFLFAAGFLFLNAFRGITTELFGMFPQIPQPLEDTIFNLNIILIVVAIGVAVLKYRLYEIDFIIRKTLVYGVLTAVLAGLYFGSVVVLQSISQILTGEAQSEVVTILSTLGIASIFAPLRRRIQTAIDRRFYRRRYDSQKILEGFTGVLSNEVDLEALTDRLVQVISETMHPEHVSVWIRNPGTKS
jgi:hypothetical protein